MRHYTDLNNVRGSSNLATHQKFSTGTRARYAWNEGDDKLTEIGIMFMI